MSNSIGAQGTKILISDALLLGPLPPAATPIAEVRSFNAGSTRNERDVTSLDSLFKEYKAGLRDFGELTFECLSVPADPGQIAVSAAYKLGARANFRIEYPDGGIDSFSGFIKQWAVSGSTDDSVIRNCSIRIDSDIVSTNGMF